MNLEDKNSFINSLIKKDSNGKEYLTLDDMYLIYDRCKLRSLVKIINEESEIMFYDEDYEKRDTNIKEEYIKISN